MTHFATADDDPAFVAEQLARFTPWAEALRAEHPGLLVHAANSAATLREPAARFDLVRCGIAIYGSTRSRRTRPSTASSRRSRCAPTSPRSSRRAGRERGLRPPLRGRAPTCVGTCRSATATACARALTNNADVLVEGRRVPLSARSRWTTSRSTSATAARPRRARPC
jgi:alanine racemase